MTIATLLHPKSMPAVRILLKICRPDLALSFKTDSSPPASGMKDNFPSVVFTALLRAPHRVASSSTHATLAYQPLCFPHSPSTLQLTSLHRWLCPPGRPFAASSLKVPFFFLNPHPRIYLLISEREEERERKREREREREKHRSAASCTYPDWGPNLQPRHVP